MCGRELELVHLIDSKSQAYLGELLRVDQSQHVHQGPVEYVGCLEDFQRQVLNTHECSRGWLHQRCERLSEWLTVISQPDLTNQVSPQLLQNGILEGQG